MPKRSDNFAFHYANGLSMLLSDQDGKIIFGINEGDEGSTIEQVGVILTLPMVKLLGQMINEVVAHHELVTNTAIPELPERLGKLKEALKGQKPKK